MDYEAHFVRDPKICGGETVFRGTRVLLRVVLADLADGNSVAEILQDFPSLTEERVRAAIAFAAAAARDDMPVPALAALGHDIDAVVSEGLQGREDEQLWPAVQAAGRRSSV